MASVKQHLEKKNRDRRKKKPNTIFRAHTPIMLALCPTLGHKANPTKTSDASSVFILLCIYIFWLLLFCFHGFYHFGTHVKDMQRWQPTNRQTNAHRKKQCNSFRTHTLKMRICNSVTHFPHLAHSATHNRLVSSMIKMVKCIGRHQL